MKQTATLFAMEPKRERLIATTPEIENAIANDAPVAFSVSGGKDGETAVLELMPYLDDRGHRGPRILVNSDLGRIEHYDAAAQVARLAQRYNLELLQVKPTHEMIDRWQRRWQANLARYINLQCVKVILPWSTPSMRFCTSEEKNAPIASGLKKRFPGQTIINVVGIRAQESAKRAKQQIVTINKGILRKSDDTAGLTWLPIHGYTLEDVIAAHDEANFPMSDVYTKHGLSRFSCSFCIMSSVEDLKASVAIESNIACYLELTELEIESTFSFQSNRWLSDVAPEFVDSDRLRQAKEQAAAREAAEKLIPKRLEYVKGWPTFVPQFNDAIIIAEVRKTVAHILGIKVLYTTPESVIARYAELMELKKQKGGDDSEIDEMPDYGMRDGSIQPLLGF
jgi:3'-phosphoadenosine 5'-phosphosulfate sulfotransferase (PAPS reductase)/FAD synthetase